MSKSLVREKLIRTFLSELKDLVTKHKVGLYYEAASGLSMVFDQFPNGGKDYGSLMLEMTVTSEGYKALFMGSKKDVNFPDHDFSCDNDLSF
jgi:hypothetical protein